MTQHAQNTPPFPASGTETASTTLATGSAQSPAGQSGQFGDDRALDVLGYVASLRRFLRPGLIVAILVFALGVGYAVTRPTSYRAEVIVRLVPGEAATEAEAVQQAAVLPMIVRSYVQLSTSPLVLDPVAKSTGDPLVTTQSLAPRLTVGNPANSLLLKFNFTDGDPDNAAKMANAIADQFVQQVPKFGQGSDGKVQVGAVVIYRPAMPIEPLPSTKVQTLLMAVIGSLAMGLLTAVALDLIIGRILPSAFVQGLRGRSKRAPKPTG